MDKNTEYFHERQRACMEADLKETVGELRRLLDVNGHPKEKKWDIALL